MTNKDCIFCKIVSGEIKSKLLTDNGKTIAFDDINPVTNVHILIVPKKHIESVFTINQSESEDIVDMFKVATDISMQKKLDAFRLSFNAGRYQHVQHLHMHLLAGSKIQWSKL